MHLWIHSLTIFRPFKIRNSWRTRLNWILFNFQLFSTSDQILFFESMAILLCNYSILFESHRWSHHPNRVSLWMFFASAFLLQLLLVHLDASDTSFFFVIRVSDDKPEKSIVKLIKSTTFIQNKITTFISYVWIGSSLENLHNFFSIFRREWNLAIHFLKISY